MLSAKENSDKLNAKSGASWASGTEGSLSATGKYSADSALAKQYAGLKEDGSSRVDDEAGWREIKKDTPPKSAAEYDSMVREYAAQGFDVKAIDMEGGDFTNANFAIKPSDYTPESGDETIQQSETLSKAKAGVAAYDEEILPNTGDIITGKNTTYKDDYLKSYKLNLAKEMEPKNADGTPRESKIQEEKDKVEGDNGFE